MSRRRVVRTSARLTATGHLSARGQARFWSVRVGGGGWVNVQQHRSESPQPPVENLLIRVEAEEDGRLRLHELHLFPTDGPVTVDRLRGIRVSGIEQLLNLPDEREAILARIDESKGRRFEVEIERFLAGFRYPRVYEPDLSASATVTALAPTVTIGEPVAPPRLKPPAGRGYPDEFYERVAGAYRDAIRQGSRPIVTIANEAGVPRSTAARWVKEARRRDKLEDAPAPGKAGG
jgi:hypothetical protein